MFALILVKDFYCYHVDIVILLLISMFPWKFVLKALVSRESNLRQMHTRVR